jgi:glyoxylase I family protein
MLLNFEHVGMTVSDIDRSLDFYVGLIGMNFRLRRPTPDGRGEVAFVESAGAQLELIKPVNGVATPARRPPDTEAGVRHLTFNFDDMDATFERLVAAGVPVVEKPRNAYNKDILARVAFVLDPDGIVIELAQRP